MGGGSEGVLRPKTPGGLRMRQSETRPGKRRWKKTRQGEKDETRQGKRRWHKTRQRKTWKSTAKQDKAKQDKKRQEKHSRTRQGKAWQAKQGKAVYQVCWSVSVSAHPGIACVWPGPWTSGPWARWGPPPGTSPGLSAAWSARPGSRCAPMWCTHRSVVGCLSWLQAWCAPALAVSDPAVITSSHRHIFVFCHE